ncbi:MAG: serine hydrolase, partial [Gemmatirosa sp.]|nr:serine hydrolase [Gemmatirosa sp.]
MRSYRFLFTMCLVCATSLGGQAPAGFDAYAAAALRTFDTPGAAVAVVLDGRVVMAAGYGVRTLGRAEPVTGHTLFQIASNTKAFTTAVLATLVDDGTLAWDDRVTRHLPWFELADPYVTRALTVRDLLTHRSGLGLGAGDLLWYGSDYPRDTVLWRLRHARLATSFRSAYAYDNVLYTAAGRVAGAAAGTTWERLVTERIFGPLGMRETYPGVRGVPNDAERATPHAVVDGRLQVVPVDTTDEVAPAGGILTSVSDLARWMTVQLDSGRVRGSAGVRLWSQARTAELWSGQTVLPATANTGGLAALVPNFNLYGLGWFLRDYRGGKVVTHTGEKAGMTSRLVLVPSRKLGIVVLTNGESRLSTALAWRLLDHFTGAPLTDWAAAYAAQRTRDAAEAAATERAASATRDAASRPSLALAGYAGRYEDAMYGSASIAVEGGHLVLRFAHSPAFVADLEPWQHDAFVARWRKRSIPDAYVTFALEPDGTIERFRMRA